MANTHSLTDGSLTYADRGLLMAQNMENNDPEAAAAIAAGIPSADRFEVCSQHGLTESSTFRSALQERLAESDVERMSFEDVPQEGRIRHSRVFIDK